MSDWRADPKPVPEELLPDYQHADPYTIGAQFPIIAKRAFEAAMNAAIQRETELNAYSLEDVLELGRHVI